MKIASTVALSLEAVKIVRFSKFVDNRGYFTEPYRKSDLEKTLPELAATHMLQANESYSRNKRDVWTVPTFGCPDAHFATFPPDLIEPCILAGSRPVDTVLDPFMGSGTVGMVARGKGRKWLGIELNPDYCALALKRIDVNRLMLTELL